MLPLYDSELDTQDYNIFQPIKTILPYDLPKLLKEEQEEAIQPQPTKNPPISFKKPEADTYCKACKKKFNNEITYKNHLKSAKHIANEKNAQPKKAAPAKSIAVNPQVQECLNQLEQAQAKNADPSQSIMIYWNTAQMLFGLKRPHYVEKALKLLIELILSSPTTSFSSAQITSFLYNSRLSLARLLCIYQQLDESRSIYLDALDGKWKLDKSELLNISKSLNTTSVADLINACDTLATKYLTRERTRTKPAPAITDINNSITTIVEEAANLFAQEKSTFQNLPSENVAVVLYAVCSLTCAFDKVNPKDTYLDNMSLVYESLDGLVHREIELKLLDMTNHWNVFNALLLSIEIDDIVKANAIYASVKDGEAYLYPDFKILCDLCDFRTTFNDDSLEQDLDHIQLLLSETKEPLLIRDRPQKEQIYILDRVRDLIIM